MFIARQRKYQCYLLGNPEKFPSSFDLMAKPTPTLRLSLLLHSLRKNV